MKIKHLMGWIAGHAGSLAIYYFADTMTERQIDQILPT